VRLNDTIGDNNELKVEIDIMRKEILFAKTSVQEMSDQIAKLKQRAKEANKISIKEGNAANEINNQILALKAKSEEGKESFELEIKKLQEKLKERDGEMENDDGKDKVAQKDGKKAEEFFNPV
jgi:hypothetical protein